MHDSPTIPRDPHGSLAAGIAPGAGPGTPRERAHGTGLGAAMGNGTRGGRGDRCGSGRSPRD